MRVRLCAAGCAFFIVGLVPPHARAEAPLGTGTQPDATDSSGASSLRYAVEGVEVRGNKRTHASVIRVFVPFRRGDVLDVNDPRLEATRWRLMGTGWFHDVRLRLKKGGTRGSVILVVEVDERNTLIVEQLAVGVSQGVTNTADRHSDLIPYFGASVAETNFLGRGLTLSLAGVASHPQQAVRARFVDPRFLGSPYLLSTSVFFNNAREFFGNHPLVSIQCPPLNRGEVCPPEVEAKNAVVFYKRYGLTVGTGRDAGDFTRYTLDWQGEIIDVPVRPLAASQVRGTDVHPIDFSIESGRSLVSMLRFGWVYDRRDDPVLPLQGTLVQVRADFASGLLGSTYEFVRLQAQVHEWLPLPWRGHAVRLGAFGGAVTGRAPFFYKFYASDLSDLTPSRVLDLNLDHRAPPNLLGTAIEVMRNEEIAGRVDAEYILCIYRGRRGARAIDAFAGAGLYALCDAGDLRVAITGYRGFSRLPVDLTFDLGVRIDTEIGLFQLGFSNVLGFFAL